MDTGAASSNSMETHFVDIHQALPEDGEEEEGITREEEKHNKSSNNKHIRVRDVKRTHRNFSRQVSLETGFSVLNRESNAKNETKVLPRSGRSFGGFDSFNRLGAEARKGDFSIFKTKPTLSKQNSLFPRKEKETESMKVDASGRVEDESVNTSVPAGRYFAALRGPELDEVKVHDLYKYNIINVNEKIRMS